MADSIPSVILPAALACAVCIVVLSAGPAPPRVMAMQALFATAVLCLPIALVAFPTGHLTLAWPSLLIAVAAAAACAWLIRTYPPQDIDGGDDWRDNRGGGGGGPPVPSIDWGRFDRERESWERSRERLLA